MKIQDLLQKSQIVIDLKAADKTDLLTQLGRFLASCHGLKNPDFIIQKILEREAEMSTGIGYGICIPHCRLDGLAHTCMVAARTADSLDYDAIDEQPVRLVFMLVSPLNTTTEHTQVLTALSKILSVEATRARLAKAATAEEFLTVVTGGEDGLEQ